MRAFVVTAPGVGGIEEVPEPVPAAGEVLVDVDVVGLCGTDLEIFRGTMPYFERGLAWFPKRPGHEWTGTVRELGADVTGFAVGERVVGDTFIGCGSCDLCRSGKHTHCLDHEELGVRGGRDGALAERLVVPARILFRVPDTMSASAAALVEPGCCSLRAVRKAGAVAGSSTLVWGAGTLGLLAAMFARALGADVTVVERARAQADLVRSLGMACVSSPGELGGRRFDAMIEATGSAAVPPLALPLVAPGGRIAHIGVPAGEVPLDLARLVLEDVTMIGILGGSEAIPETIELLSSGVIDVGPLIAARVGLAEVPEMLAAGLRIPGSAAPKIHVVPHLG